MRLKPCLVSLFLCVGSAWLCPVGSAQTIWDALARSRTLAQLHCRGGAGLEYRSLGSRQSRIAVAMTYAANPRAAGSHNRGLAPGTCALVDRPLLPAEPREVRFITAQFSSTGPGPIDTTANAAEVAPDVRSIATYLQDPGHYWTFVVLIPASLQTPGAGYFDALTQEPYVSRSSAPTPALAQAPLAAVHWLIRTQIAGGLPPGSAIDAAVSGDGHFAGSSASPIGTVRCTGIVSASLLREIEAALERARSSEWRPSYADPKNPGGCCDQYTTSLDFEQVDAGGGRTHRRTHWFSDSVGNPPAEVTSLQSLVESTVRKMCGLAVGP